MARRTRHGARAGFTLIEVIVVLAVVASLAAILTPMVVRYVEDARTSRARSDTKVIGAAVNQFYRDVGVGPVFSSSSAFDDRNPDVSVLFGPGSEPTVASGADGWGVSGPAAFDPTAASADTLAEHLISNGGGGSDIYPTSPPPGVRRGQGLFWQGPYIEAVDADPWGHRYLVHVQGFRTGSSTAAFALSAGPDGTVQTSGDQPRAGELNVGGDDLVFRIR